MQIDKYAQINLKETYKLFKKSSDKHGPGNKELKAAYFLESEEKEDNNTRETFTS
jgi:hypothetical protein